VFSKAVEVAHQRLPMHLRFLWACSGCSLHLLPRTTRFPQVLTELRMEVTCAGTGVWAWVNGIGLKGLECRASSQMYIINVHTTYQTGIPLSKLKSHLPCATPAAGLADGHASDSAQRCSSVRGAEGLSKNLWQVLWFGCPSLSCVGARIVDSRHNQSRSTKG
jgi:hypothetical protein